MTCACKPPVIPPQSGGYVLPRLGSSASGLQAIPLAPQGPLVVNERMILNGRGVCRPSDAVSVIRPGETSDRERRGTMTIPSVMSDSQMEEVDLDYDCGGRAAMLLFAARAMSVTAPHDATVDAMVGGPPTYTATTTRATASIGIELVWTLATDDATILTATITTAGYAGPSGSVANRTFTVRLGPAAGGRIYFPWLYRSATGMTDPTPVYALASIGSTIAITVPGAPASFSASVTHLTTALNATGLFLREMGAI